MKKVLSLALAAAMTVGLLTACGSSSTETPAVEGDTNTESVAEPTGEAELVLRYAENQPQDYPTTQAAYKFAELVNEKTDGRIQVEVYYGATLGDEKSVIEQLQFGGIDFTRVSLSPLAEFNKSLNVLQMPYLYTDADQMWRVLDGELGDEFLESMHDVGMEGLSWFDAGARNFYNSVRPINTIEDMKGLKIRVQESELMMDMIKALGAEPSPMAYGEVYSALQTGVIDGAENNWPSYESTSHYEVAKYFVIDEHTRVPEMQLVSDMTMEKIAAVDPSFPDIIRECAKESAQIERELWADKEAESEAKVREAGCTITELSPEEKAKFQDAMAPLYEKNPDFADLVEQIKAA